MKQFISLLIAAGLIAFAVFAFMYWLVGSDFAESRQIAVTAGITGLIIELLRPYIAKWAKMFDITDRRKPSKR